MGDSKTMITNLTEGHVMKQLFTFALPLLIASILQGLYNLVDMVVIGQVVGGNGMSAVSIGGDILMLLTFFAMGFSSAGQVLISRFVGEKRTADIQKMIGTMFTLLMIISLVMAAMCFFGRFVLLKLLNTPAESYQYTLNYVVTCICGLPFIYGYNIVSAILRGMGDSKRPFMFVAIAAVLNTVLDLLFVVGFNMEVFGAALATVIGQSVSFIVSIIYLYKHKESFGFDFKRESFRIDQEMLKPLVALGIPMAIQSAAINISKIVLTSWINSYGVIYSAMAGIYNKTGMIVGIISHSFTAAGSTMVGQNLGAKQFKRIPKILSCVFLSTVWFSLFMGIMIVFFTNQMFGIFTSDAKVLAEAGILILPILLNFGGNVTRCVAFSLINGSGNAKLNLAVALFDGMFARVGLAAFFLFILKIGCVGCWYGDALAGFVPMLVGIIYYISGLWKK